MAVAFFTLISTVFHRPLVEAPQLVAVPSVSLAGSDHAQRLDRHFYLR